MRVLLIPTLPNPPELSRRTTSIIINTTTALGLTVYSNTFYVQVEQRYTAYTIRTYSMVQSPSWEANWFAASQEIPRISRNPKVHYRTHKSPPPDSILSQPNPIHIFTSHLLEIHPNIIHPSFVVN